MNSKTAVGGFLALALMGATAEGRSVYTCKEPGKPTTFSDAPCGKDAQARELAPVPAPPPPNVEPLAAQPAPAPPPPPFAVPTPPPPPEAYRCVAANGFVFFRHQICPSSIRVQETDWVGNTPYTHTRYVPVDAFGTSKKQACAAIQKPGERAGADYDERYTTYEKNNGRDPCSH